MNKEVIINGYSIEGIEKLDKDTCCLYFKTFKEGDLLVSIIAEKWIDENKFVFIDNYFEQNGYFIDAEDTTHINEEGKEKCKDFINSWLENVVEI